MDGSDQITLYESVFSAHFLPRPRIDQILERACRCKMVYVIAGAGYGKTLAVRRFIEQQDGAVVRWLQLTENDNVGSRYWENLTHMVSHDNEELANKLRELGFPETLARFKQFAEIIGKAEHRAIKTFLVLDDFHLIHSEQALSFAERCAYLQMPGACVVIISRNEPGINAVSLLSKEQVSIITEDELRFTDTEISDYLKLRGIPFSAKDLPLFVDATKGWNLAVQLLSLVLKRAPGNVSYALGVMKQNIFKLMEVEAYNSFPKKTQKLLVKLSLVSNLPLTTLQELFHDASFLREAPQLASFVWFDSFTGENRVHPMYWEFLKSKRHILSGEETQSTYRQAAQWCTQHNFSLDAVYYFSKSGDYGRMLELLFSYPFKLPHDTCEYFLDIIENLDGDTAVDEDSIADVLVMKDFFVPRLLVGCGRYEEARDRAIAVIKKWQQSDKPIAARLLHGNYSNLVYIDMYTCTVTHKYEGPKYIKKSIEYSKQSPSPLVNASGPFTVADVRALACLVGEGASLSEFDDFVNAAKETAVYIAETHHNMYYGYDDLVECELAFFRNQPDMAKTYAHQAIVKAREKKQYSIEAMAELYMLRVSMQEGDYNAAKGVLKQLRAHLDNPVFWNRQMLYDLFTGFFYAQIGLPSKVPSWLIMDEADSTSEVRLPIRELIVSALSHIASKKYHQALTVLNSSYPREPHERFVLAELALSLLTAVARVNTGDAAGAAREFERAYALSYQGVFEMPFIERGKNLNQLIKAVTEQGGCGIPETWLKEVGRKASIYSKKASVITISFKREIKIDDSIQLSDREQEVLNDLYHGLSRDEIAENQYLSINTVKKVLQSIYIKLDANNSVDAVRIAIEKKLVE